jgi:hypothetical protein
VNFCAKLPNDIGASGTNSPNGCRTNRLPSESLGLWSLIAGDEVGRLRELLEQHPSLANDPLRQDESDDSCFLDEEHADCYPLMLAAEMGCVDVAELLLEFGADPKQRNARGDTALHFAGRSSTRSEGPGAIARLLCEHEADPEARNAGGKTPLTCGYCGTDVAEILIAVRATPAHPRLAALTVRPGLPMMAATFT